MYTILSHMPDSVRYKCPMCDGRACKLKEISNIVDHSRYLLVGLVSSYKHVMTVVNY